jgi:ribosomal protein L7/L12
MAPWRVRGHDAAMQDDLAQQIGELVVGGEKIAAIKLLREATGMGLAEAKAVIDAVERGERLPPLAEQQVQQQNASRAADPGGDVLLADALPTEVRRLAEAGNRIHAIKLLREQRGLGLKEAKDLLDRLAPIAGGAAGGGKRGCLLPLLGGLLVGGLGWWTC